MASEPEKKIEQLLRGYSHKRREQAGAPMEMHPATRRLLQGEVAKLAKASGDRPRPWWQSFFLMWPRFAATVGIFAVLAVGVWVISQNEKPHGTTDLASHRAPTESLSREAEGLVDAKKDVQDESDVDAAASVRLAREESVREKADAAKRPSEESAYNEVKLQVRDAERAPSAAAPPQPLMLADSVQEKEFSLRYDSPSKPAPAVSESKLVSSADKQRELAETLRPSAEPQLGQYFRQSAVESARANETPAKAPVGELAAAAISGTRFAGAPTNVNLFSFSDRFADTNGARRGYFNAQVTNLFPAQVVSDFSVVYSQPAPAPSAAAPTQGAADTLELAKNERARNMPAALAGLEVVAARDEFERVDGNATALLRTFDVQKAGDRIQIRDADGSVYEGAILQRDEVGEKTKETRQQLRELQRNVGAALAETSDQALSFRASGTNKSLRQLVVINGQFLEDLGLRPDAAAGKAATVAGTSAPASVTSPSPQRRMQPAPSGGSQPLPTNRAQTERGVAGRAVNLSNDARSFRPSVIRARVLVGTNAMDLNAVRRRPDR